MDAIFNILGWVMFLFFAIILLVGFISIAFEDYDHKNNDLDW